MSEEQDEKLSDLDDVLVKFDIFGRYHGTVILLITIAFASNSMYSSNFIFVAEEVSYRCASDEFQNVSGCAVNMSQNCDKWIYHDPTSFVAEYNLACQEWKRTLVGTVHSFGYMLGLLLVGPLSDRIGRKKVIVITGVLGGVIGLARSFSPWYWLYVSLEFLEAVVGDIYSPMFVLMIELVSTKNRITYSIIASFGYTLGSIITALIASRVSYWRTFLQINYGPALLFISYYFLLDESPRWLISKGRMNEAIKIIEKAANINGLELDKNVLDRLQCKEEKSVNFGYLLKSTFASRILAIRFAVCVIWWTVSSFVNYGMTINSVSLPGNKYINYAILSLIEVPGYLVILLVLLKFNRKLPLIFSFGIGGILCIAQPLVTNDLAWLATTLFMAGKLASSLYFNITYIYTSELFPTYTRNSMHALCSSLGRIGNMLAPQTPLLMRYWSGLPAFVFGVSSLVGAAATLLVPDTAHDALPDTVRQAEDIGMKTLDKRDTKNESHK